MKAISQTPNGHLSPIISIGKIDAGQGRFTIKSAILNAILYLNKSGAQWRMLPKEYPN